MRARTRRTHGVRTNPRTQARTRGARAKCEFDNARKRAAQQYARERRTRRKHQTSTSKRNKTTTKSGERDTKY